MMKVSKILLSLIFTFSHIQSYGLVSADEFDEGDRLKPSRMHELMKERGKGRPSDEEIAERRAEMQKRHGLPEDFQMPNIVGRESLEERRARLEERRQQRNERNDQRNQRGAFAQSSTSKSDVENDIQEKMKQFESSQQEVRMKEIESRRKDIEKRRRKDGNGLPENDIHTLEERFKNHKRNHFDHPHGEDVFDEFGHPHLPHDFMKDEDFLLDGFYDHHEALDRKREASSMIGTQDHMNHPRIREAQERLAQARARRNEKALGKLDKRVARITKHAERQNFDEEKLQRIRTELHAILNDEENEEYDEEGMSEEEKSAQKTEARLERLRKVEFEVMGHSDPHSHRDPRGDFGGRGMPRQPTGDL